MQGTINECLKLGYTTAQATLIGQIDDLFEEAIKLDLCTDKEAITIGLTCGRIFGQHTGKIS